MDKTIFTLTKELISIPSDAGNPEQLIEVLELAKKYLPEYEFTPYASNGVPSLLYSNTGKDNQNFKIILSAHLDVVPAEKSQFLPEEKEGKINRGRKKSEEEKKKKLEEEKKKFVLVS